MAQPHSPEAAPSTVDRPWTRELNTLGRLIGPDDEQLPGDIQRNDRGQFRFVEGQLSEGELLDRMTRSLRDRKVDTYTELNRYEQMNMMLRSLRATSEMSKSQTETERQRWRHELVLANQGAAHQEYLLEMTRQVREFYARYQTLRDLGRKLNLPLSRKFDAREQQAGQFLRCLNGAMESRVMFANALNLRSQLQLKRGMGGLSQRIRELEAQGARSPEQDAELRRKKYELAFAEKLGLGQAAEQELQTQYDQALMALPSDDRAVLQTNNEIAIRTRANELNQRITDILSGKKEALGFGEEFVPQLVYIELWQYFDENLLSLQKELERSAAREAPGRTVTQLQYLRNVRREMSGDLVAFTNDLGQYQMTLDEVARVQNQVGHSMVLDGVTPARPTVAPRDAEQLAAWLESRAQHRQQALYTALEDADKMLQPGIAERIEDVWTKQGEIIVMDTAMRLAKIASGWLPSESNGAGILERLYQQAAGMAGLPRSREQNIESLAGPMREVLGWPKDKTWAQMTPEEKSEVLKRTKSVLDAMRGFDRSKIANLRRSMAAIDEMHAKYPPSTFSNEPVDQEVLTALSGRRVDRDMTGTQVAGKIVNRATAYILLLRQRREDWGDPETRTGFIGEYAKLLDSLDENVKHHLDVAGALYRMQRAWFKYAGDLVKLAAAGALAPWILWAIWGAGTVVLPVARYVGGKLYRGGRSVLGRGAGLLRGLPEYAETRGLTTEALTKMRYLARERQVSQWLENSRAGQWFSRLGALKNSRIIRGGGKVLKYGTAALIPAIATYETYNTYQRVSGAQGNEGLRGVYREGYTTTGLETAGLTVTLPLSLGPQIVLAAPVLWAGNYSRSRSEVRAGWERRPEDWAREFDSTGLMTQLRETTLSNAVEAGGGGALKPRIMFPSRQDQQEAADTINRSQEVARGNIMEAYFMRNLFIPKDASDDMPQKMLRWKMDYMRTVTSGHFQDTFSYVFEEADLYAELMLRKEEMEKRGEPLLLSYFTEEGERRWLDLTKLAAGSGLEKQSIVTQYRQYVRPVEEVYLFNTLGELHRDSPAKYQEASRTVRRLVITKLTHAIHRADSYVESVDWPGVDFLGMTSGNTKAMNVVRSYLASQVDNRLNSIVPNLLEGNVTPEKYFEAMSDCAGILSTMQTAVEDGRGDQYYAEAAQYFGENLSNAQNPGKNPLVGLISDVLTPEAQ